MLKRRQIFGEDIPENFRVCIAMGVTQHIAKVRYLPPGNITTVLARYMRWHVR